MANKLRRWHTALIIGEDEDERAWEKLLSLQSAPLLRFARNISPYVLAKNIDIIIAIT